MPFKLKKITKSDRKSVIAIEKFKDKKMQIRFQTALSNHSTVLKGQVDERVEDSWSNWKKTAVETAKEVVGH